MRRLRQGQDTTPAAFYLGLCRLRGILSPPAPHGYAAGRPFFFAATKIRVGRRPSLRQGQDATPTAFYLGLCRLHGILSLPAPHDYAAGGPFFFAATKIRVGRGPLFQQGQDTTPAAFYLGLCRLRGILSPPAHHGYAAGGPFFFAATKIRIGRGRSLSRRS